MALQHIVVIFQDWIKFDLLSLNFSINLFVSLFISFNYLLTIAVPLSLKSDCFQIIFSLIIILVMNYRDYIAIEPNKRGGKPCVRDLRITVYEVLEYLASEMSEAEILDDFPDLTREDLKACIAYAADGIKSLDLFPNF